MMMMSTRRLQHCATHGSELAGPGSSHSERIWTDCDGVKRIIERSGGWEEDLLVLGQNRGGESHGCNSDQKREQLHLESTVGLQPPKWNELAIFSPYTFDPRTFAQQGR